MFDKNGEILVLQFLSTLDLDQLRSRMALMAFFRELGEAVEDAELVSTTHALLPVEVT